MECLSAPHRMARRTPASRDGRRRRPDTLTPGKQSVCRSLFGPVDHDLITRELHELESSLNRQDAQKWNFDFTRETPLAGEGRFQWQKVDEGDQSVPEIYSLPGLATASTPTCPARINTSRDLDLELRLSPIVTVASTDKENLASPTRVSAVTSPRQPTPDRHLRAKRTASPLMVRAPRKEMEAGSLSKIRIQSRILGK